MKKLHKWMLSTLFVIFLALFLLSAWRFYQMVNREPIELILSGDNVLP
ncbi:hypothetical protein HZA41_01860 [Candidatus Peregrinibacteria bacterium]|nr:hypothetical protein [Candidatus Peregrinibacteria bacterium]